MDSAAVARFLPRAWDRAEARRPRGRDRSQGPRSPARGRQPAALRRFAPRHRRRTGPPRHSWWRSSARPLLAHARRYLRTLADSRALITAATAARRVVVIGASFIG